MSDNVEWGSLGEEEQEKFDYIKVYLIINRTYKLCITAELDVCSQGFSFDSVSKEFFKEEPDSFDFDYNEGVKLTDPEKNNFINKYYDNDYVELTLGNIEIITKVNKFERKIAERKREDKLQGSKSVTSNSETQTTPHYYQEYNERRFKTDQNTDKTTKGQLLDRVKVKLFYEELEERGEDDIENVFKITDEKNKKLMVIIGRILEFCLISLIVITTILCIILLCAIKFC